MDLCYSGTSLKLTQFVFLSANEESLNAEILFKQQGLNREKLQRNERSFQPARNHARSHD